MTPYGVSVTLNIFKSKQALLYMKIGQFNHISFLIC